MITVKVAYEDVIDPVEICLKPHKLHLCALSAIDEKMSVLNFNQLSGWKPAISRQCSA